MSAAVATDSAHADRRPHRDGRRRRGVGAGDALADPPHLPGAPGARARALGVWTAVSGLALALGPVIGGVLVAPAGLAEHLLVQPRARRASRSPPPPSRSPRAATRKGRQLDVPGPRDGRLGDPGRDLRRDRGREPGYGTWWIACLFAVSAALVVAFVLDRAARAGSGAEARVPARTRPSAAANVVAFATNLSVFSVFFFTALYLQLIANFSGFQIALVLRVARGRDDRRRPVRRAVDGARRAARADGARLRALGPRAPARRLAAHARRPTSPRSRWPLAIAGLGFGIALVDGDAAVLDARPAGASRAWPPRP